MVITDLPIFFSLTEIFPRKFFNRNPTSYFWKKVARRTQLHLNKLEKSPGLIIFKVNALLSKDQQLKSLYYFITKGIKELYNRYEELCEAKDRKLNSTKEAIHVSKLANTTNLYDGCEKNHPDRVEILKEKIIRVVITTGQTTNKMQF